MILFDILIVLCCNILSQSRVNCCISFLYLDEAVKLQVAESPIQIYRYSTQLMCFILLSRSLLDGNKFGDNRFILAMMLNALQSALLQTGLQSVCNRSAWSANGLQCKVCGLQVDLHILDWLIRYHTYSNQLPCLEGAEAKDHLHVLQ